MTLRVRFFPNVHRGFREYLNEDSMKIIKILIFSILFLLTLRSRPAIAISNPLAAPNNRFGIHIIDEGDLEDAAELVNSEGGDWGYATVVIRKDERDTSRWQKVFDRMRKLHLIPIIRIATIQEGENWEKPVADEIDGWVSFLNSLNWVVKNRYVIVGNEPNNSMEWGGEVEPEEYAKYLTEIASRLKIKSEDFFILPAGLDASAPHNGLFMDEEIFIKRMLKANPEIFNLIDGWNSHSYPNPDFSGSVNDTGRESIRTFEWELQLLENLGVEKDLPVFITETGWAHDIDTSSSNYKNTKQVSENYVYAFENVWNNEKIAAITPFILNYQDNPFDIFSWKKDAGNYYNFYFDVQKLKKTKGTPIQEIKGEYIVKLLPMLIKSDGKKWGLAYIKNTGQKIWGDDETITLNLNDRKTIILHFSPSVTEPGHSGLFYFTTEISSEK